MKQDNINIVNNQQPPLTTLNNSINTHHQHRRIPTFEQQRSSTPTSKKVQIFLSSFLAYTSIHALRTTYSFSKSFLPDQINIEQQYIGIADSVMLLFIGLGNFLIAMRPFQKPIRALWIALTLCAIQYTFVPISMNLLTGSTAFGILVFQMGINGFLQSFSWPNLLPLVHSVYSPDKDTTLLGFWATCPNFGNIIGFVISQYLVLNNGYSWEVGVYIISVYILLNAIYIAVRIDEMPNLPLEHKQKKQLSEVQNINQPLLQNKQNSEIERKSLVYPSIAQEFSQYPSIIQVFKHSPRVTLLTISFSLLKSVMYGILLWLPVYFYTIGLVDYSLYIPMTFDGAAILGSIILGAIFKRLSPRKKNLALVPVLFFLLIFFLMLKIIDFSVKGYFIVIGLVGLCLGGSYNTMASLVTMQLVRTVPAQLQTKYLRFYSALLMAIANIITAITQVIISFTIGQSEGALFGFFVTYTSINLCAMIGVVLIQFYTLSDLKINKTEEKTTNKIASDKSSDSNRNYSQIEIIDINKPNSLSNAYPNEKL